MLSLKYLQMLSKQRVNNKRYICFTSLFTIKSRVQCHAQYFLEISLWQEFISGPLWYCNNSRAAGFQELQKLTLVLVYTFTNCIIIKVCTGFVLYRVLVCQLKHYLWVVLAACISTYPLWVSCGLVACSPLQVTWGLLLSTQLGDLHCMLQQNKST